MKTYYIDIRVREGEEGDEFHSMEVRSDHASSSHLEAELMDLIHKYIQDNSV